MIPILVEPSSFSFDLAFKNQRFASASAELREFQNFVLKINSFLDALKASNIKIATSKEIHKFFIAAVPSPVYQNPRHPAAATARQVILQKLSKQIKVVHEFGNHDLELEFDLNTIDVSNNLHITETYLHWKDLACLVYLGVLLPVCIKSEYTSLFNKNFFELKDNRVVSRIDIISKLEDINSNSQFQLYLLTSRTNSELSIASVPCHGTGTHDSMWGNKIRSILDVPTFERQLLSKLMSSGFVKSIKFLDFFGQFSSSEYPYIEIKEVNQGQNSDNIIGILRGVGKKQNGQRICIEVLSNTGDLIKEAFSSEINEVTLDLFINYAASAKED